MTFLSKSSSRPGCREHDLAERFPLFGIMLQQLIRCRSFLVGGPDWPTVAQRFGPTALARYRAGLHCRKPPGCEACAAATRPQCCPAARSEEHTSELQSLR